MHAGAAPERETCGGSGTGRRTRGPAADLVRGGLGTVDRHRGPSASFEKSSALIYASIGDRNDDQAAAERQWEDRPPGAAVAGGIGFGAERICRAANSSRGGRDVNLGC